MKLLLLFAGIGRDIQWTTFGIAVAIMAGVALLMALCIILISRFCTVKEDPRIKEVEQRLAGANCGACGHPGCSGFAKALVEGTATLDSCGQTNKEAQIEISIFSVSHTTEMQNLLLRSWLAAAEVNATISTLTKVTETASTKICLPADAKHAK